MSDEKNKAPTGLSADSKRLWTELCTLYDFNDPAARVILRTALQARDRIEEARRAIKKSGITTTNRFGVHVMHPALQIEATARRQMLHAFKELGLDGGTL